uniref:Bloodthirsty-related gene family, member 1 n=1 Tax=Neogobius melanostomus TaxID=47308 RepID=A0A8C6T5C7_9GOBI
WRRSCPGPSAECSTVCLSPPRGVSSSSNGSEEQFLCSICLEVFSEPVSTPCGHNFCKRCISQTWDTNESCFCPLCKEVFSIRPQLKTNTFISEMVSQWKLEAERRSKRVSKPGDVQCDVCSEPKLKAVKSCLVCLSSFCESHLQPHLSAPRLKRHQLMEPPFNLYCSTDQSCVCTMCAFREHKNHEVLSLEEAFEQEKRLKVQEITAALELSEREALIQQLQQEMCELEKSSTEAQQLSLSTDPLHFLQRCPALPPAGLKDWSSVSFEPQTCEGSAARALSELETSLSQKFNKFRLRRVQQFAVDVTLDPDTAHPRLVLSKDLKQVHDTDVWKQLPDSPQRFTNHVIVLGKQSFSSGRFYFEVQVKGKTMWTLGVARESVNRNGQISGCPKDGYWTIRLINRDEYKACDDPSVPLSPQRPPQKVGVFVDYGAGLVSFYDVDSADLLYSFTNCSFRGNLFPLFFPELNKGGTNSAPLIISAVETK